MEGAVEVFYDEEIVVWNTGNRKCIIYAFEFLDLTEFNLQGLQDKGYSPSS